MNLKSVLLWTAIGGCALLFFNCATAAIPALEQQIGESVVFIGQEPAFLAWHPLRSQPLRVRSTYLPSADTVEYVEGRDFIVDYAAGTLRRTAQSRLPDFRTNSLFGQQNFDHSRFPGFGNEGFFAFIDYSFTNTAGWPVQASQIDFLNKTQAKLSGGQALNIIAFGDSITAGMNVSQPAYVFWNRWARELQRKYPAAHITILNGATSGDTTAMGLQRLQAKVLGQHPDLVLIGFGMNDHNQKGVPVPLFEQNLKTMITRIRRETGAEVILYSAFPPNPKWKFGSHHMADYAAATQRVADEMACAYADVYDNWQALAARKKPEDLLANDVNHPNDFGHWIYFSVFNKLGL